MCICHAYLAIEGYKEAAEKFRDEAEMQLPSTYDGDKLDRRNQIRDTVLLGNIIDAVQLMNDFYPELLDTNRTLHFTLLVYFLYIFLIISSRFISTSSAALAIVISHISQRQRQKLRIRHDPR